MATKQSALTPEKKTTAEPINLRKQIGSTTFEVAVHFSGTSRETITDKILRLVKSEVCENA